MDLGIAGRVPAERSAGRLSKTLAREVGRVGVTVNVVVPGRIGTSASIPVGRCGDPAEHAAVVAFLASPPQVTGSLVRADGGLVPST
ncbi:SDR family oxidoreductase [Lentzea rhizosphaerae]|uniref:SDR family oxidoreductase n=1 Tax=Lentzea rhizosphaerae TaxID=2041025 RepID=A0ABV8C196_9PSEU